MNRITTSLLLSTAALALPSAAHALGSYGVGGSLGQGAFVADGELNRTPVNLELVPCYALPLVRLEVGIVTDLEAPEFGDRQFGLRPGVTLAVPVLPYFRLALPMRLTGEFDYGVMAGIGYELPIAPMIGITAEVDSYFSKEGDWGGNGYQVDGRLGARFDF